MKKTLITVCLIAVSAVAHSQVGISTSNPQGTFHIDGAKDNPVTGAPDAAQQSNDFTVTNLGRVGMGTTAPAGRLHVYNSITGSESANDYVFDDESPITQTPGLILRRSNAGANLVQDDFIGAMLFNPKINGAFSYGGAGIAGIYRGDGTTASTALAFRINANHEAGRFAENGFLGIGTTTPKQQLHIVQNGISSGITTGYITAGAIFTGNSTASDLSGPGFYLENANAAAGSRLLKINYSQNSTEPVLNFQNVSDNAGVAGAAIMTLTRSGRLGLGATSPRGIMNIVVDNKGSGAANDLYFDGYGTSLAPYIFLSSANGTLAAPVNLADGDIIGGIQFNPRVNGAWSGSTGFVSTYRGDGTTNLSDLKFTTSSAQRMFIDENGLFGIGTTAPYTIFNASQVSVGTDSGTGIHVRSSSTDLNGLLFLEKTTASITNDQFVFFRANGVNIGSITGTGPAGVAYNTTSDMRLKENIKSTHYGITDVMKIQVRDYNYKADKNSPQTGFIAQQLYTIFPDAVTVGGEDVSKPWMVDYSKITPLLTKAIQDQQIEIQALKDELNALKAMIKEMSNKGK